MAPVCTDIVVVDANQQQYLPSTHFAPIVPFYIFCLCRYSTQILADVTQKYFYLNSHTFNGIAHVYRCRKQTYLLMHSLDLENCSMCAAGLSVKFKCMDT